MREIFRSKCKLLSERLAILNKLLVELKQQIILDDLSSELNTQVKVGRHFCSATSWLEEIDVEGESFDLINKSEEKYYSYVIYTKKEYHTVGLGLIYKNELIAPHMDFCIEDIIKKYNDVELSEINKLIDDNIKKIDIDIDYLNSHKEIHAHEHYYGEYNKGFDSRYRYETILDVINDFKKR